MEVVRIRIFDGLDYNWAFGQVNFTIVYHNFSHFALALQAVSTLHGKMKNPSPVYFSRELRA